MVKPDEVLTAKSYEIDFSFIKLIAAIALVQTQCVVPKTGVGKLFVQRATFEKNVAAEGHTLSLQNKFALCVKKTHILNTIFVFHTRVHLILFIQL